MRGREKRLGRVQRREPGSETNSRMQLIKFRSGPGGKDDEEEEGRQDGRPYE